MVNNYDGTNVNAGNFQLQGISANLVVPEPSSLGLMGLGGLLICWRKRG